MKSLKVFDLSIQGLYGQNTGNTKPKSKHLSKTTQKSSGATTKCSWADAHALTQRSVTMVRWLQNRRRKLNS
ncbi:hypothetical protein pdam_00022652 [Pocillopora damicornis]|uniref:Uncharacterized protein n=1 Tax=Pocillopora damicornis TaxID=46731 RepID=A0A3M6U9H7_POCDA|nr:hypothetical protein pdam_00022652 [Pocillopora damicornis]